MSDKSRSKQEALLLEERIEKIRKRNEEIKRRHLEVEADKQNAAKLNALVQITSPSEDWPIGGRSSPPLQQQQCNQGTSRPRRLEPYKSPQSNSSGSSAKVYSFGEGDGPPPDPKYKFLADSERDSGKNNFDRRQAKPHRGRGGGRGSPQDRNVQQHRSGQQKPYRENDHHHPEYEAWRAERIRIDNDRISRQKTAEGHWRREWDHEKITQEEDVILPARSSRGGTSRRSNSWNTNYHYNHNENYNSPKENQGSVGSPMSERGQEGRGSGIQRTNRGNLRGRRVIKPKEELTAGIVSRNEGSAPLPTERNVMSVGESIKVSVPNDSTSVVKRVKVNSPIVGGTGRVGPRQKIRVSYSSQSEDEAPHSRTVEIQSTRVSIQSDSDAPNHSASTASSKPPLPPSLGYKAEAPRPRRQRVKRVEYKKRIERKNSENGEESTDKNDDSERGNESGADDSWEDVTTTSGNESACEEISPSNKPEVVLDTAYDGKLENCGIINNISNSESCVGLSDVTHVESKNESVTNNEPSIPQEIRNCDEHVIVATSNMQSEIENNLADTVTKCSFSESAAVHEINEATQANVRNGTKTETVVPTSMEKESKFEENVTYVNSEEKPAPVRE